MIKTRAFGPWFVQSDTEIVTESGQFIATTHAPDSDIGTALEYERATLIAAAPDMLAALELAEHTAIGGLDGDAAAALEDILSTVRAAIAKATGKASP